MKNFIKTTLAAIFGLALFATSAHAQAVFNSPGEMPTVTVSNSTRTVCNYGPINGCWQTSTTAQAGDVVAVHLYYKNTSSVAAQGTTLGMNPQSSGATTSMSFHGGIASLSGPRIVGSATVSISSSQTLTYITGSAKWYPSATSGTRPVDDSALFGTSGFNVGTVNPGEQGALVAFFKVGNDVVTTRYQCNDGIDNDSDGYFDYPNDPGCSSPTDDSEYNDTQSQCVINDFYASPTNVTSGGYTTLYWNTTGCDYVTIDGVTYSVDGPGSFGPIYSSRNYVLQALRNGISQTRQAFVNVNQTTNYTYQCNDGYDNDGDGLRDYPADPGCSSYTDDSEYNQTIISNTAPQAITTNASSVGQTTARLNGLAVPNTSYATITWFDWGTTASFGSRTSSQSVTGNSSTYVSDTVSGLTPGVVYYYRTVVQNQNGTAYGEPVRFQAQRDTVIINNPPRVITKVVTQKDVVVANSAPSLLELRVENVYDQMCIGGEMDYTISYRNISGSTLKDTVLRVTHPKELTFINSSRGDYEVVDRTVTIPLGDLPAGATGSVQVRAKVNSSAVVGNLAVTTATVVYTNSTTRAQEDAIAYSLVTVSNDCPSTNNLGANAFGIGSFFPHTLLGWLLLIVVILALIVLGRQLYKKKE